MQKPNASATVILCCLLNSKNLSQNFGQLQIPIAGDVDVNYPPQKGAIIFATIACEVKFLYVLGSM